MIRLILISLGLFASSLTFAGNTIRNYDSAIGAEVIVRQVLDRKLLPEQNSNFYEDIQFALEGSGEAKVHVDMTAIYCERSLGVDDCDISFYGIFTEGEQNEPEFSFKVRARVYHGTVMSATIEDFAG